MAEEEEKGGADSLRPLSLSSTQKHGTCGAHTQIACAALPSMVRLMCTRRLQEHVFQRLRHNHMQM